MAQRLVLPHAHAALEVSSYEPSKPQAGQLQIRVYATSLNHLDWKRIDKNLFIPAFPHVLGTDMAGVVIDANTSSRFKTGDRVLAPGVVGWSDGCSYQTHALANETNVAALPKRIDFKAASTIPYCLMTAAASLYVNLGLHMEKGVSHSTEAVLIWGANSSVGSFAVQLAKLSGYFVIAVTSTSAKRQRAIRAGADEVFGADDPRLAFRISEVAPDLAFAFDTVVVGDTTPKVLDCCSSSRKTNIATVILYPGADLGARCNTSSVFSGEIFGKTMRGQPSERGLQVGQWLWAGLPTWLERGQIVPLEYEVLGGLESIEMGLERMKTGAVGHKLVADLC